MDDWTADRRRYGPKAWLLQPSLWAVSVYRFGRWTRMAPLPFRAPAHALYFAAYSVVRLLTGIDIPRSVSIGRGLMIHHFGGIIVNPQVEIGSMCTMRHGVTIGKKHDDGGVPTIGNGVSIGAYAQILGDVKVGDNAVIGALSVVLHDVPDGATVVGSPARPVPVRASGDDR
jgi:serine O-acetyltransferase